MEKALFGAGCFWGVEEYFANINGVIETKVGYSGGITENPSYESVCTGTTNHAEVLQIHYNENITSYKALLNHFWKCHDPTTLNRQGPDIGSQYRSVIFYYDEDQKKIAEESKNNKQKEIQNIIVTEIIETKSFFMAEEYHQCYIKKNS